MWQYSLLLNCKISWSHAMTCKCSVTSLYKNIGWYIDIKIFLYWKSCIVRHLFRSWPAWHELSPASLLSPLSVHWRLQVSTSHLRMVNSWTRSDFQSISDGTNHVEKPAQRRRYSFFCLCILHSWWAVVTALSFFCTEKLTLLPGALYKKVSLPVLCSQVTMLCWTVHCAYIMMNRW